MKNSILLLILFTLTSIFGQQAYYDDVDLTLSGISLKDELAAKITTTHENNLSYSEAREALKIVDLVPGQGTYVYLVYGFAPEVCPTSTSNDNDHRRRDKSSFGGGATCQWNREHSYPKSLGTPNLGTSGPGADAHMLRACDVQRNSQRGSLLFNDGTGNSGNAGSGWYPGDEWKGDMARIMMYMYLRYNDQCLPDNVGYGNSVANDSHMIDLFLQWNADDPVSEYEENRNNYLENIANTYGQGNRNPFIDNPYLATRIWGGTSAEDIWGIYLSTPEYEQLDFSINPNPNNGQFYIQGLTSTQNTYVIIQSIQGAQISKQLILSLNTPIDMPAFNSGIYLVRVFSENKSGVQKLIIK